MLKARINHSQLFAFAATLSLAIAGSAKADPIFIPTDTTGAPANDLQYQGHEIDVDHAVDLREKKVDLSVLDPTPTDVWQNTSYPASDEQGVPFPAEASEVAYDIDPGSTAGLVRARVLYTQPRNLVMAPLSFQLVVGTHLHDALARAALMRRLGYPIPSPRHYKKLTVRFSGPNLKDAILAREAFLDQISDASAMAREGFYIAKPADQPTLTLIDVALERSQIDVPMYHWGVIRSVDLKGRRSVRSLLVPLVLMAVPETINGFAWKAGSIVDNQLAFDFPNAASFAETTFDDIRWMTRRMAQLTRADLEEIVRLAHYPAEVQALVIEKLVSRRDQLMEIAEVHREVPRAIRHYDYDSKLTLGKGEIVKRGSLLQAQFPGYPMYFALLKMPESRLRPGQIWRYLAVNQIGNVVNELLGQINDRILTMGSPTDVVKKHQAKMIQNVLEFFQKNPGSPYQQRVHAWAGPVGGFNVTANRDVITGTYYGSNSKVQLVDSIGVRASVGLFIGTDGIGSRMKGMTPSGNLGVSVVRNYVHVRPIDDMKTALKSDWKDVFVTGVMGKLSNMLKAGPTATVEAQAAQLKGFLDELQEDEMFVVTDTVIGNASIQASIPIPLLIGPNMSKYDPSVGLRIASQPQMIRRTTFVRTDTGVQVYIQDAQIGNFDIELDLNWLVNVLALEQNKKVGNAEAEAYLIDTKQILDNKDAATVRALNVGLRSLLRFQEVAPLREKFGHYQLDHHLTARIRRVKFLPFVFRNLKEEHEVAIDAPGENGGVTKGNTRTLFSQKIVNTRGIDAWSLVADIGKALTSGLVDVSNNAGPNPAYSFLGRGFWTVYRSEAEITPGRETVPYTTVERNWGGWLMGHDHMVKLLGRLNQEVQELNLDRPLMHLEEFSTMKKLQLFQIVATFTVYDKGVQKILSELIKPATADEVVKNLIAVEGQGDLEEFCQNARRRNRHVQRERGVRTKFSCLKPWMEDALEIRKDLLNDSNPDSAEDRVRFANHLVKKLEHKLELATLMKWLGKERFFYRVRISGFRTKDENGDVEYVSDSIGTRDQDAGGGPFRDLSDETGLMQSEVFGTYMSEGY